MIAVIVPFSRPQFAQNVIDNFERQEFRQKVLIVVENGRALGRFPKVSGVYVTQSLPDRSHARNEGIRTIRSLGLDYFAIHEDDDLYDPPYLDAVWQARHKGDVTGLQTYRLRGDDGSEWLMCPGREDQELDYSQEGSGLLAATLAGWTHKALPFVPGIECGEEIVWYFDMLRSGCKLWSRGAQHFTLQRYADPEHRHTSRVHWSKELKGAVRLK